MNKRILTRFTIFLIYITSDSYRYKFNKLTYIYSHNALNIDIYNKAMQTALAKLTGISPLHGSHAAIPIACDALNARAMAVQEYHYHDREVMTVTLPKITNGS
ncbi:hypothetical protein J18TS1_24670 [Oceanobacillus oncorhynchi subsp. incaldanensis]|nr:hypothetical protein J18TS1_24670 [Oceanobacillus oncorhynchi subsp. incaldanensis]